MASVLDNMSHAAERKFFEVMIDGMLKHLNKQEDKTDTYVKKI